MRTIYTIKSICPAFCEKNTLFRRGVLLPKIECLLIIKSRMRQSITSLASVTEMFQLKIHITGPDSPFINNQKWQRHDWNAIAHNTRLSSSCVNPKLNQWLESESVCLLHQLWIDAYSKSCIFVEVNDLFLSGSKEQKMFHQHSICKNVWNLFMDIDLKSYNAMCQ